jgi:L-ascorbate metabolism protein UlaG (beta-lactamase superfamily)
VKVQWLGHSSFRLEESTGTAVVTDPYHSYVGYSMPPVSADAVTISHHHRDHNYLPAVSGAVEVIDQLGAFEVKGIHIHSTKSYHDNEKGKKRGLNLVFHFRIDGVEVCHMGDIGEDCNVFMVETIMPVNILLIPVGGQFTLDAKEAKEYIDRIMPDIVIPMHYRIKNSEIDLEKLSNFWTCLRKKTSSVLTETQLSLTAMILTASKQRCMFYNLKVKNN